MLKYCIYSTPLPRIRNFKGNLIRNIPDFLADLFAEGIRQSARSTSEYFRRFFAFFNLSRFDKCFFFCFNPFKKNACWFVIWILRNKFTLYRHLKDGVFQLLCSHDNSSMLIPRISVICASMRSMSAFKLARFS